MNVRPLGEKILVKRAEARDKTDSGIYPPESAKDQPKEGKVTRGRGGWQAQTQEDQYRRQPFHAGTVITGPAGGLKTCGP